jgi:hypothetical protein
MIYSVCRACGRTLTGDYEKRNGICTGLIMCQERKRKRDGGQASKARTSANSPKGYAPSRRKP